MNNSIGITGYLVDVVNNSHGPIVVDGSLSDYYKVLNCDCFDITRRKIGGSYFDIMCDDEGLLKDDYMVSAFDSNMNPCLVGNLLVVKHDREGNTISLKDRELEFIREYIRHATFKGCPAPYPVLVNVDY